MTSQNGAGADPDPGPPTGARPRGSRAGYAVAAFLAALTLAGVIGIGILLLRPSTTDAGTFCEGPVAAVGADRHEDSDDWESCTDERIRSLGLSVSIALAAATLYAVRTIEWPADATGRVPAGDDSTAPGDGGGKSTSG